MNAMRVVATILCVALCRAVLAGRGVAPCAHVASRYQLIDVPAIGTVWYADATDKVFVDDVPPTATAPSGIATALLCAARREVVMLQVAVTAAANALLGAATLDCEMSVVNASHPDIGHSVRSVGFTNVTFAVNAAGRTGLFADPLPFGAQQTVPAGRTRAWWVQATVPEAFTDDSFDLTLQLRSSRDGTALATVAVAVHVWNFTLPTHADASQRTDAAFGSGRRYDGRPSLSEAMDAPAGATGVVEDFYHNWITHGVNRLVWRGIEAHALPLLQLSPDNRTATLDFRLFDAEVERVLALGLRRGFRFPLPNGVSDMLACHHTCPRDLKFVFTVVKNTSDWKQGHAEWHIPVLADPDATARNAMNHPLNPDFAALFNVTVQAMRAHIVSKGWWQHFSTAVFIDEPTYGDNVTLGTLLAVAKLYRAQASDMGWSQTRFPVPDVPAVTSLVTAWVAHVEQVNTPGVLEAMATLRKTRGVELYIYNNGVPIVDLPGQRLRTFPWQIWRTNYANPTTRGFGLQGSLSWYTNTGWSRDPRVPNPWVTPNQNPQCIRPDGRAACPYNAAGWGMLVYPPRDLNFSQPPVDSIRWQLFAKGVQDAEYFVQLAAAVDAANASCACAGASRAVNLAETLRASQCCEAVAAGAAALEAVGGVVWGFSGVKQFVSTPGAPIPYTSNTTQMNTALTHTAVALEELQRWV